MAAENEDVSLSVKANSAEKAVEDLMRALGLDRSLPGLADTPRRVVQAYRQLLTPVAFEASTFPNESGFQGLVHVHDVNFVSICEHHLLPFFGSASLGYVPNNRILGLSKLARAVGYFAAGPQVQERLTTQVANWLSDVTESPDVGVILSAEHSCMSARGVRAVGARTRTSDLRGQMRDNVSVNHEFLRII